MKATKLKIEGRKYIEKQLKRKDLTPLEIAKLREMLKVVK